MSEEEDIDIKQQLENLLMKLQPNLQDVIKRSFTNVALQQTKNGEHTQPDALDDTSYCAKNTQVNLSRLELVKSPSFHIQSLSLDLQSMGLTFRCSIGEVSVKGIYSAYNENLYNLIPVMADGHVLITLSNLIADVNVGLVLKDDALSFINPGVDFLHDEVLVKLSWPSPQRSGGYEFVTTEQMAKHIDDLPLSAAISLPLHARLQQRLLCQLEQALGRAVSVSDLVGCNAPLLEAYSGKVEELASIGNKVVDLVLINVRRTLLQSRAEVVEMPSLHATFLHRVGSISYVGKFDTDTGWLKNLSTINRTCDVSVSRLDPLRTTFRVSLRIKDLQIGFDEYRIKALGLGCGGRLAASFGDNCIHLAISVGLARWEPYSQLDQLNVQCLHGMDLHITGLGPLSSLSPLVGGWVRGTSVANGARIVTNTLHTQIHTALRELALWDVAHQNRTT